MPTKLIIGENSVIENQKLLSGLGKSCLIVTGKNSARACGALDDVITALDGQKISYTIFDEVTQNPHLSTCVKASQVAKSFGAQFILGIGGGSPQDAAKAIAVLAANEIAPSDLYKGGFKSPSLPVALVGTTSGTGSEVTQFAVITDDEGKKHSILTPDGFAAIAFGDPRYTASVSAKFTVSTALDAIAHLIEGYFNKKADSTSDLFALEGIRLLCDNIDSIYGKAPADITLDQRTQLYLASIYGGIVIAQTGTCYCHSLGYFLTEEHDIPHGIACAVYLPYYIARGVHYMPERATKLATEIGMSMEDLSALISSTTDFEDMSVSEQKIESIANWYIGSGNYKNSPGDFDAKEAAVILRELFSTK